MPLEFVIHPQEIEAVHYYEDTVRLTPWMIDTHTQILSSSTFKHSQLTNLDIYDLDY